MIDSERHDAFDVDVLARIQRVRELRGVQVRRRGDHHGVNGAVLQQPPVIGVSRGAWNHALRALKIARINVGEGRNFGVGTRADLAHQFHAAVARADDAHADAIRRAQHFGRIRPPASRRVRWRPCR